MRCNILGFPVEEGTDRVGCALGPAALRDVGLVETLVRLGHEVVDQGNVDRADMVVPPHPNLAVNNLQDIAGWTRSISEAAYGASGDAFPIFLGGDHSIAMGTVSGVARRAAEVGRPLFVLWLDAHSDFHTLETTQSGNLHGIPLAYLCGLPGFSGYLPEVAVPLRPERVCAFGLRSVDDPERQALLEAGVVPCDMSKIDRRGIVALLEPFLGKVRAENGMLHVSLDVDFLDPSIAPAVGTTVPGGTTFREAHLIMEMLHESELVTSLDVVELNPTLDVGDRTARLMVDLVASLFGRTILGLSSKAA